MIFVHLFIPKDTLLAWKKRNKIGQFREVDPEEAKRAEEAKQAELAREKAMVDSFHIGDRYLFTFFIKVLETYHYYKTQS